ncbi:membrane fusion protein (multidrug efflux system) [Aliiruegeria haliotis]|uniref:Membrane fusion protein (Multidrug efflux system) n=1 Tax=Aliiruegeria haliotis TaxID=1280846 RepID=A0A2T0S083_9RHOB|nr:efflux RND transporter periplasmic adaptor subunit [Aliiruegeria haliotis]PRY26810.1 membrane fusion protein (multidrug efflux system) [Aliiruegeria haliotis]
MLPCFRTVKPFLVATVLAAGAVSASAQDGAPTVKVSVAAAYTEDLIDEVSFIGRGEAIDKVDIVARVNGFLQDVMVGDGQAVAEGDLLFRIEPDAYQATLEARKADLARAEASLELAGIELTRKQELVNRQASPQSEADVARANEKVAEAEVQAAQAAIRAAELDVSYTEISAPFPGRIGAVERSVGDIVGPNTPALVTLVREQPMEVVFSLSEKQYVALLEQIGTHATDEAFHERTPDVFVTLPNGNRLEEAGRVVFIDNRIDPTTGTIALRARFENEGRFILDGSFIDVTIQAMEPSQKLLIPLAAVQRDQRGDFALIVKPDQLVEQRYITLGRQHETSVVVADGMQEGEMVIVEGLQRVRPGVSVESVLAGSPAEGSAPAEDGQSDTSATE